MTLKYLGHAAFFIRTKGARIVMDPFDSKMIGLKFPKQEADIVTVSHSHGDHNAVSAVGGDPLVIDLPGEYEKLGARVYGIKYYHDKNKGADRGENILFKVEADDVSLLHMGDLGTTLDDATLSEVGDVDVLLVPTGGFFTIDPEEAVKVVKQLEPQIVVPMHYQVDGLTSEIKSKLAPVSEFIKKMGIESPEPVKELVIKKDALDGSTKVVIMSST